MPESMDESNFPIPIIIKKTNITSTGEELIELK
jgi:hypothetical protein